MPLALVLVVWSSVVSWVDLPDEFPSHWSGARADAFLPTFSYVNVQSSSAAVAALVTTVMVIGNLWGWKWSPLARGISAVGAGVTAAISMGLYVQMFRSRGLSIEEAGELGVGAGALGVVGGFVIFALLSAAISPSGRHSPSQ